MRLGRSEVRVATFGARTAPALLVGIAAVFSVSAPPAAAQPAPPAGGQSPPFGILDNAFLVEEAFNQEAGVFQNIFGLHIGPNGEWESAFTQEWPLGGWRHQMSYTVPVASLGAGSGLGDLQLHYRLQVMPETARRPAFAPRFSLILPSGSEDKDLGGRAGWQVNLPFSKQAGDAYLHWNAGFTHVPGDGEGPFTPHAAAAVMWRARPMFHPLLEAVVEFEDRPTGRAARWTIAPGARIGWDVGDSQTVIGLAAPLVVDGGRVHAGGFVYFSYELPFGSL